MTDAPDPTGPLAKLTTAALLFSAAVVPFLARAHVNPVASEAWRALGGEVPVYDFFARIKVAALVPAALVATACAWWRLRRRVVPHVRAATWTALGLGGLTALSTALSPWPAESVAGNPWLGDGLPGTLAMIGLFWAAAHAPAAWRRLPPAIAATGLAALTLGLVETWRPDWLTAGPVARLVLGEMADQGQGWHRADVGGFVISFANRTFAGMFGAMVFPVGAALALSATRWRSFALYAALSQAALLFTAGSLSRGGLIGATVGGLVAAVLARSWQPARRTRALALAGASLLSWYVSTTFHSEQLAPRMDLAWSETMAVTSALPAILAAQPAEDPVDPAGDPDGTGKRKRRPPFMARLEGGRLRLALNGPEMLVEARPDGVALMGSGYQPLAVARAGGELRITTEPYDVYGISLEPLDDMTLLTVNHGPARVTAAVTPKGLRLLHGKRFLRPAAAARFPLPVPDSFFGGRGYIWSRTLAMLKTCWLVGRGPGTFALDFPHSDVGAMISVFGQANLIVDKPHNLYLAVAHAAGIPALIIMVLSLGLTMHRSFRLAPRLSAADPRAAALPAALAGMSGWLIAGIANDATVFCGAGFWVLWGLAAGATTSEPA